MSVPQRTLSPARQRSVPSWATALAVIALLLQGVVAAPGATDDVHRVLALQAFCGGSSSSSDPAHTPGLPHDHAQCGICSLGAVAAILPSPARPPAPPWASKPAAPPRIAGSVAASRLAYLSRAPPAVG